MESENWSWVYVGLTGLGEMMIETTDADILFDGTAKPPFMTARHFTTVKVRKETREEMNARAKAYKVEMPIQETIIETFPWIVEQEGAIKEDGVLFMQSVAWARRPCDELVEAANRIWKKSNIVKIC